MDTKELLKSINMIDSLLVTASESTKAWKKGHKEGVMSAYIDGLSDGYVNARNMILTYKMQLISELAEQQKGESNELE